MLTYNLDLKRNELQLSFSGDIISTNVDELDAKLRALVDNSAVWSQNWSTLTIDMTSTQMLDSLGLNLIVSLLKRVRERPITVRTYLRSRIVYQTLLATRMDKLMTLHLEEKR